MISPIKKLQNFLPEDDDCAVIMSEENRNYLLGFAASNGTLIVSHDDAFFFTDSRYITAAKETIKDALVILQTASVYDTLKQILEKVECKKVAFEATKITVAQFSTINKKLDNIKLDFSGRLDNLLVHELRRKKDESEINKIKKAQAVTDACFKHICSFIREGMTEKQVQLEMDYYMLSHGADALSFETIVVSGENSAKPHGVPSSKKIKNGEFVTMDFGAVCDFYHSDMTRTVCVGKASAKMKKVYNIVLEAQETAIKEASEGMPCSDVDAAARDIIERAGYGKYFGHGTGHGVGIEIHEEPCFSPLSADLFVEGDVVTVEPGIYIPNEFGVRIEDMIYNDGKNIVDLTHSPKIIMELDN